MTTITISKKEYHELLDRALRYQYLSSLFNEDIFASPPEKRINLIMKKFHSSKQYKREFLQSLERGLKRSLYFQK